MVHQANTGWRRVIIVASITLGMLLAALDTMIMSTAMPIIKNKLGNFSLYSWVFSAYMLTSTVTVPLYGKLADMFGRKKVFSAALLLFIIGSALCGTAASMWQLVLYRAIQGLGAGGVVPLTVTIAGDLYSVEQRGKIQGLFSSMWALSGIAGPVVGGWIIEHWHWSWIFWINIPIGIAAMFGFLLFREQVQPERRKIDSVGALILSISITLFLFATLAQSWGIVAALLVASIIMFLLFVRWEKRQEHPLVRLDFFADPMLKWINISALLVTMGLFSIPSFIPLFAQDVLGYTPLSSGLLLLAQVAGWNILAIFTGKLIIRYGYRNLALSAMILLLAGGIILLGFGLSITYLTLFISLFVMGMGFGLGMTTFIIAAQEAVKPAERGISTSIQMFSRNIGATIGITLVGGVMNAGNSAFSLGTSFMFVFTISLLITASAIFTTFRVPRNIQQSGS